MEGTRRRGSSRSRWLDGVKKHPQQMGVCGTGEMLPKDGTSGEELFWKPRATEACRAKEEEGVWCAQRWVWVARLREGRGRGEDGRGTIDVFVSDMVCSWTISVSGFISIRRLLL